MRIIYKEAGKEYTSKDSNKNYLYKTNDNVMHGTDGAKFALEYGDGKAVEVDEHEIEVSNGYPQYDGDSIIIHGVKDNGLVVQYGDTKDSRGYKTIPCNTPVLVKLAEAYKMLG